MMNKVALFRPSYSHLPSFELKAFLSVRTNQLHKSSSRRVDLSCKMPPVMLLQNQKHKYKLYPRIP